MTTPETPKSRQVDNYKVGRKDEQGMEILRVYTSTPIYVVYRTQVGLRIFTDEDNLPDDQRVYYKRCLRIAPELARVYSLQPAGLSRAESINGQIARAIHQCLEDNLDSSRALLQEAERRLVQLRRLQGRLEYLVSAFLVLVVTLALLLVITYLSGVASHSSDALLYLRMVSCGALGGLLSVALGVWTLDVDLDANRSLNIIAGGSRIVIAEIASIVALFLVKSNIVLGTFASGEEYGLYVAGVVAGFSEAFVPNVIRSLSREEDSPTTLEKAEEKTGEDSPTTLEKAEEKTDVK